MEDARDEGWEESRGTRRDRRPSSMGEFRTVDMLCFRDVLIRDWMGKKASLSSSELSSWSSE